MRMYDRVPSLFTRNSHTIVCSLAIPQYKIKSLRKNKINRCEQMDKVKRRCEVGLIGVWGGLWGTSLT